MRLIIATRSTALPDARLIFVCVRMIVKTVCAREDVAFMFVAATVRAFVPESSSLAMASYEPTAERVRSSTKKPLSRPMRTGRLSPLDRSKRSRTFSL